MDKCQNINSLKELKNRLKNIKDFDFNISAMQKVFVLHEYAAVFVNQFKVSLKKIYDTPEHHLSEQMRFEKDPLYLWLNEQINFRKAKLRLMKAGVLADLNKLSFALPTECFKQYSLEYIFSLMICFLADSPPLEDAIVVPVEQRRLVEKHEEDLTLMARGFEFSGEKHLFLYLVERLKQSNGSPFDAGTRRYPPARLFMTKRLVELTYEFLQCEALTENLITSVVLDISGVFFDAMKSTEAKKFIKTVIDSTKRHRFFLEQKVSDLINN